MCLTQAYYAFDFTYKLFIILSRNSFNFAYYSQIKTILKLLIINLLTQNITCVTYLEYARKDSAKMILNIISMLS